MAKTLMEIAVQNLKNKIMKFIISSKYLANTLSNIDFSDDNVETIILHTHSKTNILTIQTRKTSLEIVVNMVLEKPFFKTIRQNSRRWDWLKMLVTQVAEQPIVIEVTENSLDITFQY